MKYLYLTLLIYLYCTILLSCNEQQNSTYQPVNQDKQGKKDTLEVINKYLLKQDSERIESYIKRHGWKTQTTETGLRYEIYEHGTGDNLTPGDIAEINYKIELLDGTKCYDSDTTGTKKIKLGKGGVESGLEQGLLLMKVGDKARFIMPPYLAQGLLGDFKRIPARATIIYFVELKDITEF